MLTATTSNLVPPKARPRFPDVAAGVVAASQSGKPTPTRKMKGKQMICANHHVPRPILPRKPKNFEIVDSSLSPWSSMETAG